MTTCSCVKIGDDFHVSCVLHITCAILFDKAIECLFLLLLWDSKNYVSLGRQQTTWMCDLLYADEYRILVSAG